VEKWWALQVVTFARRAPGPRWTTDVSLARLEELMSVPVEFRSDSNALPTHAEISLQDALKNLTPGQLDTVLRLKLRDIALDELRLAPPFGVLADDYRGVLAGFLGEANVGVRVPVANRHGVRVDPEASLEDTLKQLDVLDQRRRDAETRVLTSLPGNFQAGTP
jgi:hypothetical protein